MSESTSTASISVTITLQAHTAKQAERIKQQAIAMFAGYENLSVRVTAIDGAALPAAAAETLGLEPTGEAGEGAPINPPGSTSGLSAALKIRIGDRLRDKFVPDRMVKVVGITPEEIIVQDEKTGKDQPVPVKSIECYEPAT